MKGAITMNRTRTENSKRAYIAPSIECFLLEVEGRNAFTGSIGGQNTAGESTLNGGGGSAAPLSFGLSKTNNEATDEVSFD
jgi:hypothetical protein